MSNRFSLGGDCLGRLIGFWPVSLDRLLKNPGGLNLLIPDLDLGLNLLIPNLRVCRFCSLLSAWTSTSPSYAVVASIHRRQCRRRRLRHMPSSPPSVDINAVVVAIRHRFCWPFDIDFGWSFDIVLCCLLCWTFDIDSRPCSLCLSPLLFVLVITLSPDRSTLIRASRRCRCLPSKPRSSLLHALFVKAESIEFLLSVSLAALSISDHCLPSLPTAFYVISL